MSEPSFKGAMALVCALTSIMLIGSAVIGSIPAAIYGFYHWSKYEDSIMDKCKYEYSDTFSCGEISSGTDSAGTCDGYKSIHYYSTQNNQTCMELLYDDTDCDCGSKVNQPKYDENDGWNDCWIFDCNKSSNKGWTFNHPQRELWIGIAGVIGFPVFCIIEIILVKLFCKSDKKKADLSPPVPLHLQNVNQWNL